MHRANSARAVIARNETGSRLSWVKEHWMLLLAMVVIVISVPDIKIAKE